LRHESGTSIQPRGLSIASTERSSKMMGIGSQPGSSMKLGLDNVLENGLLRFFAAQNLVGHFATRIIWISRFEILVKDFFWN
jgi:hypothetical protein